MKAITSPFAVNEHPSTRCFVISIFPSARKLFDWFWDIHVENAAAWLWYPLAEQHRVFPNQPKRTSRYRHDSARAAKGGYVRFLSRKIRSQDQASCVSFHMSCAPKTGGSAAAAEEPARCSIGCARRWH